MVTAGKVFKLVEPMPLPDLASKLSGYRREETYEEGDYKFTLVTNIVGPETPARKPSQAYTPTIM